MSDPEKKDETAVSDAELAHVHGGATSDFSGAISRALIDSLKLQGLWAAGEWSGNLYSYSF